MNSEHVTGQLDDYVAGRLTAEQRAAVEEHLAGCAHCSAELRAYDPVPFDDLQFRDGDDGLRRTVRRALGRTAIDAAALAVIILLGGVMLSLFVIQPLLINRSDRAAVAARAAYEAPMLFNPGVEVPEYRIESGLLDRRATSQVHTPLGSGSEGPLAITSRVGLFGIDLEWNTRLDARPVGTREVLSGIGAGTVITVALAPPVSLSIDEAQNLADDPGRDVRITWVGFDVLSSRFGTVGYPLCLADDHRSDELFAASSAGFSGWATGSPPSVERALESARDALELFSSQDEVAAALAPGDEGAIRSVAEAMRGERRVSSFVVTGPSPEVASFLDDLGVTEGQVLAVGLYSWGSPVCGR